MPKIAFIKLNEERKANNQQTFSTQEMQLSGSIRQLDPEITKQRKLRFFGYTIISKKNILVYITRYQKYFIKK